VDGSNDTEISPNDQITQKNVAN